MTAAPMQNARLWFARIVTLYALAIFTFLACLYIAKPLENIARFGVSASGVPESINFLRSAPGALVSYPRAEASRSLA